jgi:hypothetical protein
MHKKYVRLCSLPVDFHLINNIQEFEKPDHSEQNIKLTNLNFL